MNNNSVGGNLTDAGAGVRGGHIQTAPAQFQVGAVGFGPMWTAEDSMAESIVRIQRELEEAQAQIAVYEAERSILKNERDELRQKNKTLAQCWRDAEQERDEFRMRLESSK